MDIKYCDAFYMDDAVEAWKHIHEDKSILIKYGSEGYGHDFYTWDEGDRKLVRCKCGGYILVQRSEYHGQDDDYYTDYFPVSGELEADWLNREYDGYEIENKFEKRYLMFDNLYAHWSADEKILPKEESGFLRIKQNLLEQEARRVREEEEYKRSLHELEENIKKEYEEYYQKRIKYFGLDACKIDKELTESYGLLEDVDVIYMGAPYILWVELTPECSLEQLIEKVARLRFESCKEDMNSYRYGIYSEFYDNSTVGRILNPHRVAIISDSKPELTDDQLDKCNKYGITYAKHIDDKVYYDFLSNAVYSRKDCYECVTEDAVSIVSIHWIEHPIAAFKTNLQREREKRIANC